VRATGITGVPAPDGGALETAQAIANHEIAAHD